MINIAWNIRGMNDSSKQQEINRIIKSHNVYIIVIHESRVKRKNKERVIKKQGRKWSWVHNYCFSHKRRIWVGWDANHVNVSVSYVLEQVISVEISDKIKKYIFHYFLYLWITLNQDKRILWQDLQCIRFAIGGKWVF